MSGYLARVLVVTLAVIGVARPNGAAAQTFDIVSCADSLGAANHSWTAYNNHGGPGGMETGNACGSVGSFGGLFVRDALDCADKCTLPPTDTAAGWRFSVPTGTSISALSYKRWLYKVDDDNWQPALRADGIVLEQCAITYPNSSCAVGAEGGSRTSVTLGGASQVEVGVRCLPNPTQNCTHGATLHEIAAVLYGATVTLSDPSSPTVSNVAGTLFSDGYLTGTRSASFDASDNVGIRSSRLYVDGSPLGATTYGCDFTYVIPCSDKSGAALALDTRSLSDGTHSVDVAASDAALNESRSAARTITVDNGAPEAPLGLAVDGGATRSTAAFAVSWTNPAGQVAPIVAAQWRICDSNGNQCRTGREPGESITSISGLALDGLGDWRVSVWLEDAAGNVSPTNSATVAVNYSLPGPDAPSTTDRPPDAAPVLASNPVDSAVADPARSEPTPTLSPARSVAGLRITSARYSRGRLIVAGRTTSSASGQLTVTLRTDKRATKIRRTVRGGGFRIVIPMRKRPRSFTVRYAGSPRFLPATLRRTVR